jgi:hypothetical protein
VQTTSVQGLRSLSVVSELPHRTCLHIAYCIHLLSCIYSVQCVYLLSVFAKSCIYHFVLELSLFSFVRTMHWKYIDACICIPGHIGWFGIWQIAAAFRRVFTCFFVFWNPIVRCCFQLVFLHLPPSPFLSFRNVRYCFPPMLCSNAPIQPFSLSSICFTSLVGYYSECS